MEKLVFFNKNNNFCCRYFEDADLRDNILLQTRVSMDNYENIVNNQDRISNIFFSRNNIVFYIDDLKVVLVNKDNFKNTSLYKILIRKIKEKKLKLKKLKKSLLAVSLTLTLIGGIALPVKNNIVHAVTENTDSGIEQIEEVYNYDTVYVDDHKEDYDKNIKNDFIGTEVESEKHKFVLENYGDIIDKYATMYNVNPNIIAAIATQERGVHSNKIDKGGAIGLMQIQVGVWDNKELTIYNNLTNRNETINITLDKLKDVDFNIKVGCAIFQDCLKRSNNNSLVAIQMYNMGTGTVNKILNNYAKETGRTKNDVLNDSNDTGWLNYRNGYQGDSKYAEHVSRYIGDTLELDTNLGKSNK